MNSPVQAVRIANVDISQDAAGRYRLNDVHVASGSEPRHAPPLWTNNQGTQELISELRKPLISADIGITGSAIEPIVTMKGGNGVQGTFAVKELVYIYSMWISPIFHLHVVRTFDATVNRQPMTLGEQCLASAQAIVAIEREQARMARDLKQVNQRLDMLDGDTGYATILAYARRRGWTLPLELANALGRNAAQGCKNRSVLIGTVADERFGRVNSYPIALLDEMCRGWAPPAPH